MSALLYFQTQPLPTLGVAVPLSPGSSTAPGPVITSLTPTLTWQAASNAGGYLLNIHNITANTYFTPTISGGSTTSYTVPSGTLLPGDQYSWHLYAETSPGNMTGSTMSALMYFQTQPVAAPSTPILVSPGSSNSSTPPLTSLTTAFTWQADSGATSYLINIHNITTNTYYTATISSGSATSFTPPTGTLVAGDQYSWHLYATNAGGTSTSILLYFRT
jgi:hypothetical protein